MINTHSCIVDSTAAINDMQYEVKYQNRDNIPLNISIINTISATEDVT